MVTWSDYLEVAQAYAAGVRGLLAQGSGPLPETMRGWDASGAAGGDLAERAGLLAPLSNQLTQLASGLLDHEDPLARSHAAGRLLAKSLTDLQVSALLYRAAQVEDRQAWATRGDEAEEIVGAPDPADIEESLGLVLAEPPLPWPSAAVRALAPDSGSAVDPATRMQLARAITDTLVDVRNEAAGAGQAALGGLLSLGLVEVAQAAGLVGLDIAAALGHGPAVARLYNQARDFLLGAYGTIVAALGPTLARTAASQVTAWVAELQAGGHFGQMLDRMYQTNQTGAALGQLVTTGQASADKFRSAGQALAALQAQFRQQAGLVEKIARVLALIGTAPATMIPYGRIVLASGYVGLGGYIVLAGADFVDAPRMRLIDRVPGVRRIVEADLGPCPPAAAAKPATAGAASGTKASQLAGKAQTRAVEEAGASAPRNGTLPHPVPSGGGPVRVDMGPSRRMARG
jgi:hypothetical protein